MENLWHWIDQPQDDEFDKNQISLLSQIHQINKKVLPTAIITGNFFSQLATHNRLASIAAKLNSNNQTLSNWNRKINDIDFPDEFPEIILEIYHRLVKRNVLALRLCMGWKSSNNWQIVFAPIIGESNLAIAIKDGLSKLTTEKISNSQKINFANLTALIQPVIPTDFTCKVKKHKGQLLEVELIHGYEDWGLINEETPTSFLVGQNSRTIFPLNHGTQKHLLNYNHNSSHWSEASHKVLNKTINEKVLDEICEDYAQISLQTNVNLEIKYLITSNNWFIKSAQIQNSFNIQEVNENLNIIGTGDSLYAGTVKGPIVKFTTQKIKSDQIALVNNWKNKYKNLLSQAKGLIIEKIDSQHDLNDWLQETAIPTIYNCKFKIPISTNQIIILDSKKGLVYLQKQNLSSKKIDFKPKDTPPIQIVENSKLATNFWPIVTHSINTEINSFSSGAVWNLANIWKKLNVHPHHAQKKQIRDLVTQEIQNSISLLSQQLAPRPLIVQLTKMHHSEWEDLNYGKVYESEPLTSIKRYLNHDWQLFTEMTAIRELRQNLRLTNIWIEIVEPRNIQELRTIKKELAGIGLLRTHSFKLMIEIDSWYLLDQISHFPEIGIDGITINWEELVKNYTNNHSHELNNYWPDSLSTKLKTLIKYSQQNDLKLYFRIDESTIPQLSKLIPIGISNISINQHLIKETISTIQHFEHELAQNKV